MSLTDRSIPRGTRCMELPDGRLRAGSRSSREAVCPPSTAGIDASRGMRCTSRSDSREDPRDTTRRRCRGCSTPPGHGRARQAPGVAVGRSGSRRDRRNIQCVRGALQGVAPGWHVSVGRMCWAAIRRPCDTIRRRSRPDDRRAGPRGRRSGSSSNSHAVAVAESLRLLSRDDSSGKRPRHACPRAGRPSAGVVLRRTSRVRIRVRRGRHHSRRCGLRVWLVRHGDPNDICCKHRIRVACPRPSSGRDRLRRRSTDACPRARIVFGRG